MKKVVWLQVYRGSRILLREDGKVDNENQNVKLTSDTLEWSNFLKALRYNPYCKVEVVKVLQPSKDVSGKVTYKEVEISQELKSEVLLAWKGEQKVELTPEQKEIAELKAQMAELLGKGRKEVKETKVDVKEIEVVSEKVEDENTLEYYQEEHLVKFDKEVPPRYKNNIEWIKNKLNQ